MKSQSIVLFMFFFVSVVYSQVDREPSKGENRPHHFMKPNKKFEQLEQLKLLDFLKLDEETAVKFITRRNKSRDKIFGIMKNLDEVYDQIQNLLKSDQKDKNYKSLIDKSLDMENQIVLERKSFLNSLKNILTEEQIAKVILFERKFKRDIRDILIKRGRKKGFDH